MENTWKRLLSFAIALVMVIGMMPGQVFAAEVDSYDISGLTNEQIAAMAIELAEAGDETGLEAVNAQLSADPEQLAAVEALVEAALGTVAVPAVVAENTATVTVYKEVAASTATTVTVDLRYFEKLDVDVNENSGSALETAVTALRDAGATGGLIRISEGTLVVSNRQDITMGNLIIQGAGQGKTVITGDATAFNNTTNGLKVSDSKKLSSENKALLGSTVENLKVKDLTVDGGSCGYVTKIIGVVKSVADFKTVRIGGGTTCLENVTIQGSLARTNLMIGTSDSTASVVAVDCTIKDGCKMILTSYGPVEVTSGSTADLTGSVVQGAVVGNATLGKGYYKLTSGGKVAYTTIPYAIELYKAEGAVDVLLESYMGEATQGVSVAEAMTADLAAKELLYGKDCAGMRALTAEFKAALAGLSSDTGVDVAACLASLDAALEAANWHQADAAGTCTLCGTTGLVTPPVQIETPEDVEEEVQEIISGNTAVNEVETNLSQAVTQENKAAAVEQIVAGGVEEEKIAITEETVKITVQSSSTTTKMVFDVTPTLIAKDASGAILGSAEIQELAAQVTFRLPVADNGAERVAVYHEQDLLGYYAVQGTGANRYVEITAQEFSEYSWEVVDNNSVAAIGSQGYPTLADAVAAANGQTVKLLKDVTLTGGYAQDAEAGLYIDQDVTIDGQGLYTIDCGSFVKGIRIYDGTVKLQNLTVVNAKAKGRCVDTRSNVELTLENVTLKTTSADNNQTLTIGGNDHGTEVTLIDTTIEAGVAGYAIINFVKSQVEIQNSTITGYGALYFKEGSSGAEFNVIDSALNGQNIHNNPAANSFAAIAFEEDGVKVNVTGGTINVTATGEATSTAFGFGGPNKADVKDMEVNVSATTTIHGTLLDGTSYNKSTVILPASCADQLVSEGMTYAPVVGQDGQITITGKAQAAIGTKGYATLKEAVEAATEDQTVTLLADVTLTGGYAQDAEAGLYIDKDVTIDGQGLYTIDCGSFVKGIRIYGGTVKLQNLTVVNAKAKGRCVDTRSNVDLTLENVTLKTTSRDNNQTLTIGGNDHGTKVTLIDTTIEAGVAGYAIINFVKSQVEIQNSTITGYGALYFKEGSAGAEFNVTNSTLNGENVHNNPAANSFAAITFEEDGVELNVTGGSINVTATGDAISTAFSIGGYDKPVVKDVEVNISEDTTVQGKLMAGKNFENNTIILPAACTDQLVSEGVLYAPVVGEDGQITITGKALFAIGTTQYATLAAAMADATAGQTVKLVRDVDMSGEVITLFKGITLDLNGNTLTALGVSAFKGDMVIDSGNAEGRKTGVLKVSKDMLILPTNNAQLPVWNGVDGYQFATMNMTQFRFAAGYTGTGFKVEAKPAFGDAAEKTFAKEYFTDGAADNGIQILIRLTGTTTTGDTVKQDYVFNEEMIKQVYGTSGTAFGLTVSGLSNIATVKIEMIVIANDTIQSVSEPLTYTAE